MDVRKKELDAEKAKQVERLNQAWDQFTPEQKAQLQQDQSDWFEKRDVDCKVLSQKSVYDIAEKDMETYPLKRYGEVQDIAPAAIYLLSDASSWVTGCQFVIDGGVTTK